MRLTKLYISPHFDDVVFSCAGKIIADVKNGFRVIVVTVFSKSNAQDLAIYQARNAENNKALLILGAEGINLDFFDAPYRHPFYNSFRRLLLERHDLDDAEFVSRIGVVLSNLCNTILPVEVYAPLAVGGHIDHRLCFESLVSHRSCPVIFYEDRPYSFATFAVESRLKSLGVKANASDELWTAMTSENITEHLSSLSQLIFVNKYLPPGEVRSECFNLITKNLAVLPTLQYEGIKNIFTYSASETETICKAVNAYQSQVADFCGAPEQFQLQAENYSNHIAHVAQYSERFWSLKKIIY
ncbi:MAG: PIG-L family deacetylase [Pseudomonadota bacterium]